MKLLALVLAGGIVPAPGVQAWVDVQQPPSAQPPAVPAATQPGTGAPGLESAYWRLTHLGEDEVTFQKNIREPHLVFNAGGTVTGADGCNSLRGSYTVKDNTFSLGPLMGTLMSCPNLPDKLDTRFREALGNAKKWKTTATELTLLDDKDTVLARFEAVPR
ncbi:MAG: META domain-containing protein [Vicinamibacterales bacterium]